MTLELINPPLQLQKARVLRVAVRLDHVHLPVDAIVLGALLAIGSLNDLLELVFRV